MTQRTRKACCIGAVAEKIYEIYEIYESGDPMFDESVSLSPKRREFVPQMFSAAARVPSALALDDTSLFSKPFDGSIHVFMVAINSFFYLRCAHRGSVLG